ncbi:MAG: hypothetical protein NTZ74_16375 [Chloroflexi bacterium]|nr:hypothetical protein [Chloroflexota bacterium]
MTHDELEQRSKQELIDLILMQAGQLTERREVFMKLKADHEALTMKFDNNLKLPTSSMNSSQPSSRDEKSNQPKRKTRHRHGPPKGREKHE